MNIKLFITITSLLTLMITAHVGWSLSVMDLFKKKYCVFSKFEGNMTYNGNPAAGAVITRKFTLDDIDNFGVTESTTVKEDGSFSFPSRWEKVRKPFIGEFRIRQRVWVEFNEDNILIWNHAKEEPEEYADFAGEYANLHCELTEELTSFEKDSLYSVYTNCKWEITKAFEFLTTKKSS